MSRWEEAEAEFYSQIIPAFLGQPKGKRKALAAGSRRAETRSKAPFMGSAVPEGQTPKPCGNSNPNTPVAGLVERLRRYRPFDAHGISNLVNPDGPEAASHIEQLEADKRALVEALEGAADELQSCAEQFRALKMTTCAQYAEAQEVKARATISRRTA